ncbi:Kinesin-like protein [Vigna angularis]|uniref:Kinesin-like protein n=1 Tax=Phaseolus angularis TaxID=3914 RepID=A0A8T0K3K2_PHAAN|nr:Kinesin-like protein [Vigna angularis]
MEKICVAVRLRPPVSEDSSSAVGTFWNVEDNRISLHKIHGTPLSASSYAFDHIFDERSSNASVYELLAKDIIHSALDGFNGTAFAYGQTSSGKTFTMNGSETDAGVIPRAVRDIFATIETVSDREFLIRVSYMEIYNEEINDLLVVENQKLQIHESLERGVFVSGLKEEIVNNAEQVLNLIKAGEVNRHFGETNMNVIESKGKDSNSSNDCSINDVVRVSVLNLVDLAGSERIAKTGADGVRLKEGKYINKSLMVLGNVINKLSEGSKQRGHIPYRDSKLTRILQPALGGNAKTSIICTIAPEEIHIEETRGTLQFASRAKRITNCVQVNEELSVGVVRAYVVPPSLYLATVLTIEILQILTDAALLKRQQLEIEELRKKLQGSHAEVLEQQILKLRNDLLKGPGFLRHGFMEEYSDISSISQGDIFKSPKADPSAFVVRRSKYSTLPDQSPLPDVFCNVADEDMWLKMNNGYVADLDSLQTTPPTNRKVQSFPTIDTTGCTSEIEKYEREVQDLRRQLELAKERINELEKKHSKEVPSSKQLMGEAAKHQQEAQLIHELHLGLSESMGNFKDGFEEVLSIMQRCASGGTLSTEKIISTVSEIGAHLFATLEGHISVNMVGQRSSTENCTKDWRRNRSAAVNTRASSIFFKNSIAISTIITEALLGTCPVAEIEQMIKIYSSFSRGCRGSGLGGETAYSKEDLCERYESMERELHLLKVERESLLQKFSESSEKLSMVSSQKENVLKDLNTEVLRRKNLEGEVKQFAAAFASRQESLSSFHSDLKTEIGKWRAQTPNSLPKSFG